MIDILFDTQFFPLLTISLLGLFFLIQMGYYWLLFNRLGGFHQPSEPTGREHKKVPVSVVICAHNAHQHLRENLPLILEQDYPEYEVVVVNHSSEDDTEYLLRNLEEQHPRLTTITIHEDLNFFSGKKFPLSIGIKSAKYDTILLTDADCRPATNHWIDRMQEAYRSKTEIVLGYGAYIRKPGWLNKLIRFDTAHIAIQYLSFALAGIPYMGVGRNLSYKKQLFYRNNGFIAHYRIRSGDDDLFINRVANGSNTALMIHPDAFTLSEPKPTLAEWIIQKRRHLTTSIHYKFTHRWLLGMYTFSAFAFYLLAVFMAARAWSWIPVAGLVFLRLVSQYIVFARCMRRLNEKDVILPLPLLEISMLLMNLSVGIANLFNPPKRWK